MDHFTCNDVQNQLLNWKVDLLPVRGLFSIDVQRRLVKCHWNGMTYIILGCGYAWVCKLDVATKYSKNLFRLSPSRLKIIKRAVYLGID